MFTMKMNQMCEKTLVPNMSLMLASMPKKQSDAITIKSALIVYGAKINIGLLWLRRLHAYCFLSYLRVILF